ncbi:MAG TPA: hypothetical protein VMA83_12420 [Solirubrobacteraceae bacterium]|nr:hypothetical protein [Solirubrobacteraceae bacterium]
MATRAEDVGGKCQSRRGASAACRRRPVRKQLALFALLAAVAVVSVASARPAPRQATRTAPPYGAHRLPGGSFEASNRLQHLDERFSANGVTVSTGGSGVSLRLAAISMGAARSSVTPTTPTESANSVLYTRPGLDEWYRNGPSGLEQGFTVTRAPAVGASGTLTIAMALHTGLRPVLSRRATSIFFTRGSSTVMTYGPVHTTDARGRVLASRLAVAGGRLSVIVNARGAVYPLRVDPYFQSSTEVRQSIGFFGTSVAVSANGKTVLAGGTSNGYQRGEIGFYTRDDETLKLQAAIKRGTSLEFGKTVSLSANGSSALVGSQSGVWVFLREGESWNQEGEGFTGSIEGCRVFGEVLALSGDGNTAIFGCPEQDDAAIFVRSPSGWVQQGPILREPGVEFFGSSVALSYNGDTALVGSGYRGVWAYTREGESWSSGEELVTSSEGTPYGSVVALSGDGDTAAVGNPEYGEDSGAAWVFARSGSTWTQQGERLGSLEPFNARFGTSLALSEDGNVLMVGAPGSNCDAGCIGYASLYLRSGTSWSLRETLTPPSHIGDVVLFGSSVALSAEGTTAVIGAPDDFEYRGAVWAFFPATGPAVASTGAASDVTTRSATLSGSVNPEGEPLYSCRFEFGTTTLYGESVPCTPSPGEGETPEPTGATLYSLMPLTEYHYRIAVTNAAGTSYGEDQQFTTLPTPPTIEVPYQPASITSTSATLDATVDPEGQPLTECEFEYGQTPSLGSTAPCSELPGSGRSLVPVSAEISGLRPNTTYRYRFVAANATGRTQSGEEVFQTLPIPPVLGRCVRVAEPTGAFGNANCTEPGGKRNYEWQPGALRNHFRVSLKSGSLTLETKSRETITCREVRGGGEYVGTDEVSNLALSFAGCEHSGEMCSTAGQAAGEIAVSPLSGEFGATTAEPSPAKDGVGLLVTPSGETFAAFDCGDVPGSIVYNVIGAVKADAMKLATSVVFAQSGGKQHLERFVGGGRSVLAGGFEPGYFNFVGLGASLLLTDEEKLELNASA